MPHFVATKASFIKIRAIVSFLKITLFSIFVLLLSAFSTIAYAGNSTVYQFGAAGGNTANRDAIISASNVTHLNGGELVLYAFDVDNPGTSTLTEETSVYVSFDNQITWEKIEWDYYQISNQYTWLNYEGQSTLATYGPKIYDATASTVGNSSSEPCYGSRSCLIGQDAKFSRVVFSLGQFPAEFQSGDTLFVKVRLENSDYAGFEIDSAFLTVFTNELPTSQDFTVSAATSHVFTLANFAFQDDDTSTDGDQLEWVKVTSLPTAGSLEYNDGSSWIDVVLGQEISRADIVAGKFRATGAQTFQFKVSDGFQFSGSAYTATISAAPLTSAPPSAVLLVDWNTTNNTTYVSGASLNSRTVSVSTGTFGNAGSVFAGNWASMLGSGIAIDTSFDQGFAVPTLSTGATTTITFNSSVTNPMVLFNWADPGTVAFDFSASGGSGSFVSVARSAGSGTATATSNVVTASGYSNSAGDGFLVRLNGTFTSIVFTATGTNDTVGFSVGLDGYSVTTSVGANGSGAVNGNTLVASSTTTQVVEANGTETLSYTFTPAEAYGLDSTNSTSSCGGTFAASTSSAAISLTTSAITADCSISAAFAPVPEYSYVDMCGYVNTNPVLGTGYPVATAGVGNTGTGIPFTTCSYTGSGEMGTLVLAGANTAPAGAPSSIEINVPQVSGQNTFYALLNNYYGTVGANEYTVTVNYTDGTTQSFNSIGGTDTRDFNQNVATSNSIGANTTAWWTNYVAGQANYQRLDVRQFDISANVSKTLRSVTITQVDSRDSAMVTGLTFTTNTIGTLPDADPDTSLRVDWVDWTMPTSYPNNNTAEMLTYSRTQRSYATSASGTVVDPNTNNTVSVTLSGEILDQSLNATTWVNSENPTSAYDVGTVTSPDGEDLITQTGYTAQADKHHTITFDQPVDGVVMGIWSLGGNGVSSLLFSEDFEIIDTETNGLTKNVTDQGYELVGTAHSTDAGAAGIIQFYGSGLTSITYTVTRPEYYSGMNVALTTNSLTGTGGATKSIDVTAPVIQGPSGEPGDATSAIEVMAEQTAVTQFTADETVTWRVSGGANASAFTLNASTGVITFTTAPSYDATTPANNIYVVEVEAKDATGNTSRQTLTVTVIPNIYPNEPGSPSEDADGDGAFDDIESATLDRDGDGIVDRLDYDPQGYFYCQADGRILSGGKVTVSGPGTVTMVHDGSETNAFAGNYQWYVDTPGTYTMAIDTSGMEFRSISKATSGSMTVADFTGNPVILGSTELGATGYLGQFNGADYDPANPTNYYTTFVIAAGDPNIFGNNIPFELCEQNDVTVAATTFGAEANGGTPTNAVFRVSQPRTSLVDTVITYTVSGTATADTDYTALSGSVTIPAGQTSAYITVAILDDVLIEGPETIIVTLTGITGDESTQLSSTSANLIGTATIADDDFATVIMANDDLNTTEGRDDPATMRFSLAGQPSGPVVLTFAGDAQCSVSPSTLTFDGTDFATPQTLRIQALNDEVVEGAHSCQPTVVVTSTDTRFNGLAVTLATVTVADDLVDQIRDPLTNILQSDFQQAVATHSRQFGQISKGALGRLQSEEDLRCGDIEALDVDGTAEAGQGAFSTSGNINEDTFNCVTGVRRITKGNFAVNSSPSIDTQGIFTLTVQNEKIVNDTALRGFFYGGYLSSASLDGVATGNINGVGAHLGLYGANELSNGLFFDYYAAGALGRHEFDLSFYAPTAPIQVLGDYRYGALYAGAALSGEVEYDSVIFRPRAGFNLTYAEASDADVSATQLGITDTGRIELDTIGGTRIFAEAVWTFGEAPSSDEVEQGSMDQNMRTFEVAPRIYCTSGVTRDGRDCGYGGYISFNERNDLKGTDIAITFDYESNRERSEYLGLELSYSRDIFDGAGAMVTQFGSDHLGNAALSQSVSLDF